MVWTQYSNCYVSNDQLSTYSEINLKEASLRIMRRKLIDLRSIRSTYIPKGLQFRTITGITSWYHVLKQRVLYELSRRRIRRIGMCEETIELLRIYYNFITVHVIPAAAVSAGNTCH